MANPFFQKSAPAPVQAGANPRRGGLSGLLTATLGAKQAYTQIMHSGGDPGKIVEAVLAMPAFKNYTGSRDPQSLCKFGLRQCGLDAEDLSELARQAGFNG